MTSDAGAPPLGATDRAIGLVDRFAARFSDGRAAGRLVHDVATLVGQRVFGIALGYEDLAEARWRESGQPARLFTEFRYRTCKTWSHRRRVVGKAEWLPAGAKPRFVVTSLSTAAIDRRELYEALYCARGDMENRIKECQLDLFADRTSAQTMLANQLRLRFAAMAYVLLAALRRIALPGTRLARATCGSIRLKLLKIGAQGACGSPVKTSIRLAIFWACSRSCAMVQSAA